MNNLLTVKQVIAKLNISRSTLNKLIKQGKLPVALRLGARHDRRFFEEDLENFVKKNK